MKTSLWMVTIAVGAALALQGCASTGGVNYAPGAAPSADSATAPAKAITGITDKASFDAVRSAVEQQMQGNGRYASIDSAGRTAVNTHFDDMAALFDQYGSVDKMGTAAMIRINDDQNAINKTLAARDGDRLICREEMPVGSHLPKRVCRTLSEIRNDQYNAQQVLRIRSMSQSEIGGHN